MGLVRFQCWLGVLSLLAFLGTGVYLSQQGSALYRVEGLSSAETQRVPAVAPAGKGHLKEHLHQGKRMMYRATHIYLLFASLLNLLAGALKPGVQSSWGSKLEGVARVLLMLSPVGLLAAFFVESRVYAIQRPITFWCIVGSLSGVLLLLVSRAESLQRFLERSGSTE